MSDERAEAIAAKLNRSVAAALDKALAERDHLQHLLDQAGASIAALRADLAPSVPPVGERQEREIRLAKAVVSLAERFGPLTEEELGALVTSKRILSSPAPDPASEPRAKP